LIADIGIIILLIVFAYNGYHKGFVKSIYSILSLVATLLILFVFDDLFIEAIATSPLGVAIGDFFVESAEDSFLAQQCSSAVVYIASSIILYVAIRFVLKFLLSVLNAVASLPLIRFFNKTLGVVIGFIIGSIWVVVIVNVLFVFPQTKNFVLESLIASYFGIVFI